MRILIGYDGSEASHAALTDMRRAGLPDRAEALVLTAAEVPVVQPAVGFVAPPDVGLALPVTVEEARRAARRELERARAAAAGGAKVVAELFPGWDVRTGALIGPAYAAVVEQAGAWRADLVVVGSHGRSMLGRLFFGSVAQNVLAHAPCSVRIGRGQDPDTDKPLGFPLRLLICVDGSPGSMAAVEAVCGRTWPQGTAVRLASVADVRLAMAMIESGATVMEIDATAAGGTPLERVVRAAGDRFRNSGLDVTTVMLEGDPKHMLLREAQEWGADCVFLGAKGHSRLERFLMGSVSASVAARAGCTVEVARLAAPETAGQ